MTIEGYRKVGDPRGKIRIIVDVRPDPKGGSTVVECNCGHAYGRANHFSYCIGDHIRCYECKDN